MSKPFRILKGKMSPESLERVEEGALEMFATMSHLTVLERFEIINRIITEDEVATSLLEKLLDSAEQYFCKVFQMESGIKMARLRLDGETLRDLTENLGKNRRFAHEVLISDLCIFNRYILKEFGDDVPLGGIFSKSLEAIQDSIAVADWAGELLTALYQNRRR